MSWAKRNLYFLISGIVAVALLGAAGWYCYSAMQANSKNWDELNQDYNQLATYTSKTPNAGNDRVNNIDAARQQADQARQRVAAAEKYFLPIPSIPPSTNRLDDRALAFAVRETVAQLRSAAAEHNVVVPMDFAFSFTLQEQKAVYDPNSWAQLSKELGEVRFICNTLFNCRVSTLDSIQREPTTDDANVNTGGATGGGLDYVSSVSVTNGSIVVAPYEVTFQCFTPELGAVLSAFANQSHTVIVKTLAVQPVEMMEPGMAPTANQYAMTARNGLPVVIDEKKLKVTLALDLVKILPQPGR